MAGAKAERQALLQEAYRLFNDRQIDALFALMTDDVEWPDVAKGVVLHGEDEIRPYWEGQFAVADPRVVPIDFIDAGDDLVVVVDQRVLDFEGHTLAGPTVVFHRYTFAGDLVRRMVVFADRAAARQTTMSHPREEIEETLAQYVAMREQIDAGHGTWTDLLQFFTDDMVYIDPAWGRIEGIDAVRTFMVDSMAGLDDWKFPIEFTAIEGDDVVVKWTEVIPKPDGTAATQSGYSRLIYAGDGKFNYEEDLLNMVHVLDDIANSGWRPTGPMNVPPTQPNRDVSIPPV